MATAAREVYVVADSHKVGQTALSRFGTLKSWNGLITDRDLSSTQAAALKRAGCTVIHPPKAI